MTRREFLKTFCVAILACVLGTKTASALIPQAGQFPSKKLKATWGPEAQADLMRYHGINYMAQGYVYAPYVPVYKTPVIYDSTFAPRRSVLTRYAHEKVNHRYYGKIVIR